MCYDLQMGIQNLRSVNDLIPKIFIITMTPEGLLSCESIRLHINIGPCDLIHKRDLANIGYQQIRIVLYQKKTNQDRPSIWIY